MSLLEGLPQGPQVVRGVLGPRKAKVEAEMFDVIKLVKTRMDLFTIAKGVI